MWRGLRGGIYCVTKYDSTVETLFLEGWGLFCLLWIGFICFSVHAPSPLLERKGDKPKEYLRSAAGLFFFLNVPVVMHDNTSSTLWVSARKKS